MPLTSLRNYFAEKIARIRTEWKTFQQTHEDPVLTSEIIHDLDTKRHYAQVRSDTEQDIQILESEYQALHAGFELRNSYKHEPFELFAPMPDFHPVSEIRLPAPGIKLVPKFYHKSRIITGNIETSRPLQPDFTLDEQESYLPGDTDFGSPVDPMIMNLLIRKYPEYLPFVDKYCRPAGTTDATFRDFNKPQIPSAPSTPERESEILDLIDHFMNITPYNPIHFVDTQYCKLPYTTGTGYYNRHSYRQNAHAKFSRPQEYARYPTSKGRYINATYENARTLIHRIKETGYPMTFPFEIKPDMTDAQLVHMIDALNTFFDSYPTMLFTRNHISDRSGTLKVRPVYAVDDLFLIIELMLTFPATVQARKASCCIMHSMETLRGANCLIDVLARSFRSFFTIDWSGYDQHLPRPITDCFFMKYLRRIIIINDAYAPTYEYPDYPDLDEHTTYRKMDNLLHFLHLWYNNMTFLSADGHAYRRLFAGVPSGLYLTQFLDSFGNLYLLIDGMLEFGLTHEQIKEILLFVLGDDNSGFTHWSLPLLDSFISFLETYALTRWNMTLSKTKSVITILRNKIETLSYQCNNGLPKRPIDKLVAQLCYPEHGMRYHTMSARAIGLAYASCAIDFTFYTLCKDIHSIFLPFFNPSPGELAKLARIISPSDTTLEIDYDYSHFPSIQEIRSRISSYAGPLPYSTKWNYAHFMRDPDYAAPNYKTMSMYESEHDLTPRVAPTFAQTSDNL